MTTDKDTWESVLVILGACALIFGVSAGTWWVANAVSWWSFALVYAGTQIGYALVKDQVKKRRIARRKAEAVKRMSAVYRIHPPRRQP